MQILTIIKSKTIGVRLILSSYKSIIVSKDLLQKQLSRYYLHQMIAQKFVHSVMNMKNQNDESQPILHFLHHIRQYFPGLHSFQSKTNKQI